MKQIDYKGATLNCYRKFIMRIFKSALPQVFFSRDLLKILTNLSEKHQQWSPSFSKIEALSYLQKKYCLLFYKNVICFEMLNFTSKSFFGNVRQSIQKWTHGGLCKFCGRQADHIPSIWSVIYYFQQSNLIFNILLCLLYEGQGPSSNFASKIKLI